MVVPVIVAVSLAPRTIPPPPPRASVALVTLLFAIVLSVIIVVVTELPPMVIAPPILAEVLLLMVEPLIVKFPLVPAIAPPPNPPNVSPLAALLLFRLQFVTVAVPLTVMAPPPLFAEFPVNVVFVTCSDESLLIPPPKPDVAVLLLKVEPLIITIAPPEALRPPAEFAAVLSLTVVFVRFIVLD